MTNGISFYTYMWISEDIKNITGQKLNINESDFKQETLCGSLTNFINTVEPVLIVRARINDAQEFYSDYAARMKSIVDNLDYDILSKDGAMVDNVKFITNKVDEFNTNFDAVIQDMNDFMNMTDNYILDMYNVHLEIFNAIPSQMEKVTNEVLSKHTDFTVVIPNHDLKSFESIKAEIFRQLSSQNLWFWDHLTDYIDKNNYDDIAKYHLVMCMYYILVHVSSSVLKSGKSDISEKFKNDFDNIVKEISEKIIPILNQNNTKYQVVDTSSIDAKLKKIEKAEKQYKDFIDEAHAFPVKKDGSQQKSIDLDALIKGNADGA